MKTHLTSTQAELDQMKAELDLAAVKSDAPVLGWAFEYMADNQVPKVLAVGAGMPEALCTEQPGTYGPLVLGSYVFHPHTDIEFRPIVEQLKALVTELNNAADQTRLVLEECAYRHAADRLEEILKGI